MRRIAKYIVQRTFKPWLEKYVSETRVYSYKGIRLQVPPEVFHPRFFFSTKLLLKQLKQLTLTDKYFLELGAGSGLLSVYAAKQGAHVTATDINSIAVEALKTNRGLNKINMKVIESDVFDRIPRQSFDVIAINPPYYKKDPKSEKDHAWYCGVNGEYFDKLFFRIGDYIHSDSQVLMILCDGCDVEMIKQKAAQHSFVLKLIRTHNNLLEQNFIFSIEKVNTFHKHVTAIA
jgi:release factor glutamine methyltransferase